MMVKSIVEIDNEGTWPTHDLCCPKCGGAHLHHELVVVSQRFEDEDTCLQVSVGNRQCSVSEEGNNLNPSSRRHGLSIRFWCEICQAKPKLSIAQHKNSTKMYWETDQ